MVRCIFRKRRLLKPPRIKSKTGCPEVDLLTEFDCISSLVAFAAKGETKEKRDKNRFKAVFSFRLIFIAGLM